MNFMFHFKKEDGGKEERGRVVVDFHGETNPSYYVDHGTEFQESFFFANYLMLIAGFFIESYFQAVLCYKFRYCPA